jgi:protoporphyrinogen oxidase
MEKYDYIILGSGPSGLTAAYCLAKAGKKILIVDRNSRAGGLSMSYSYNMNNQEHIFDTGPKRFHTDDPIVINFLNEILEMKKIGRSTEVYFHKKYFTWPLSLKALIKFPLILSIKSLIDLFVRKKYSGLDQKKFENYIKFRYGKTLYNEFFKPYTEKFLKWPISDIHSDWASTGINRTVIDARIKSENAFSIVKNLMLPNKIDTEFLYPKEKGFGYFFDTLYRLCLETNNCDFIFNSTIDKMQTIDSGLIAEIKNIKYEVQQSIVWTGNLNDLISVISESSGIKQERRFQLNYLNTTFYNFIFSADDVKHKGAQWLYVSDGNSLISRITCMKEFSDKTSPEGFYNFIIEVTDSQSSPIHMNKDDENVNKIIQELKLMKFITINAKLLKIAIVPVQDTYPIYSLFYKEAFAEAHRLVKNYSKNIYLLGRSGAFWYNNSDHSIRMAIEFANRQLKNNSEDFDYRAYFGGTH